MHALCIFPSGELHRCDPFMTPSSSVAFLPPPSSLEGWLVEHSRPFFSSMELCNSWHEEDYLAHDFL